MCVCVSVDNCTVFNKKKLTRKSFNMCVYFFMFSNLEILFSAHSKKCTLRYSGIVYVPERAGKSAPPPRIEGVRRLV
jgi:hypothetical protein